MLHSENVLQLLELSDQLFRVTSSEIYSSSIRHGSPSPPSIERVNVSRSFLAKAQKTFGAILQLSRLGYGQDASQLCRTLVELLIRLKFILDDKTDGELRKWMNHGDVARGALYRDTRNNSVKDATGLLKSVASRIETSQFFPELEGYMGLSSNLHKRSGKSEYEWSDASLYRMAEDSGLMHFFVSVYAPQGLLIHSHVLGVNQYLGAEKKMRSIVYDWLPSEKQVFNGLYFAFGAYSEVLLLFSEAMGLDLAERVVSLRQERDRKFGEE